MIHIHPNMSLKEFLETFFPEYQLTDFQYEILEAIEKYHPSKFKLRQGRFPLFTPTLPTS